MPSGKRYAYALDDETGSAMVSRHFARYDVSRTCSTHSRSRTCHSRHRIESDFASPISDLLFGQARRSRCYFANRNRRSWRDLRSQSCARQGSWSVVSYVLGLHRRRRSDEASGVVWYGGTRVRSNRCNRHRRLGRALSSPSDEQSQYKDRGLARVYERPRFGYERTNPTQTAIRRLP